MRWIHRIEVVVGVWTLTSPWILGYASSSAALWNSVVVGASVALLGLWGMFGTGDGVGGVPMSKTDKNNI